MALAYGAVRKTGLTQFEHELLLRGKQRRSEARQRKKVSSGKLISAKPMCSGLALRDITNTSSQAAGLAEGGGGGESSSAGEADSAASAGEPGGAASSSAGESEAQSALMEDDDEQFFQAAYLQRAMNATRSAR